MGVLLWGVPRQVQGVSPDMWQVPCLLCLAWS